VTADGRSLTGIAGDAGGNTQSFAYDALHRLTGSSGLAAGSTSYQYDLDGNRTRRVEAGVTTDYLYDRVDQLQQQTIGVTTHSFDYDRYGNLTSSWDAANAQTTYGHDAASRLTGITPPAGGAVSFTIDALDRPATRSVVGTGTSDNYGYVGPSETAYLTGSGTTTGSLLDAEGTRLAVKTGSRVSWLVFDLHGSVAGLCPSGTTALADAYRYDGWGRQVAKSGSSTNPFRYRGLLNLGYDDLSGALLAMGAREYSSQLGTFTQEDSVAGSAANPASMNRFLYALANPATLVDPDGHMVPGAADEPYYEMPPIPPIPTSVTCDISGYCHGGTATRSETPPNTAGPPDDRGDSTAADDPVNPWALRQDPIFQDAVRSLLSRCQNLLLPDYQACAALHELREIAEANKAQYCALHAMECLELEEQDAQANRLLIATTLETLAAIALMAEPLPGDEAIPAGMAGATGAARQTIVERFNRLLGEAGLFTHRGKSPNVTALGHSGDPARKLPEYVEFAHSIQATYYQMPSWLYSRIKSRELRWAFNEGFLNARAKAGDIFRLLSEPMPGGAFAREVDYLRKQKNYILGHDAYGPYLRPPS
jgi:RHS repeat-associated protein